MLQPSVQLCTFSKKKERPQSAVITRKATNRDLEKEPSIANLNTAGASSNKPVLQNILIHVFDENKRTKKDFICKKSILIKEMKYFNQSLREKKTTGQVEIDVHCDIDVFEWLMTYITKDIKIQSPKIAISILISSHFLQMDRLQEEALDYLHQHIDEIVKVPVDMSCINEHLMNKLSNKFSINQIARFNDPKDRLKSHLLRYKIKEIFLENESQNLRRCLNCQKIYIQGEMLEVCSAGALKLDFYGNMFSAHVPADFDVNELIAEVYVNSNSWTQTFWKLWGLVNKLICRNCSRSISCEDFIVSNCPAKKSVICCDQETSQVFDPFRGTEVGCVHSLHVANHETFNITVELFQYFKESFEKTEELPMHRSGHLEVPYFLFQKNPYSNKN